EFTALRFVASAVPNEVRFVCCRGARHGERPAFDTNAATPRTEASRYNKSDSGVFTFRSRWCYCAKIIAAVVEAFLLVASCFHLPAARDPGHDRLGQARHLAAAAGAVVAE